MLNNVGTSDIHASEKARCFYSIFDILGIIFVDAITNCEYFLIIGKQLND